MQDVERLVEQAQEQTGLSDLADADWREGLDRLLDAFEDEARLSEIGRAVVENDLVGYLVRRLELTQWRKEHPSIATADVTQPIVVIGQARTGTTILHDLLAQDPASRVPLAWEVDRPVPPPQTATYTTDPRIAETEAVQEMVDLVIPGFRSMHPVGAQLAQECVRITGAAFRSMIFPTQYRVPSYGHWLLHEADMAPAYRWHRAYLQHLQSEHRAERPGGAGASPARWVLKSPGHLWCLDALLAEYPDALLVQTHRDPLKIIASVSSLMSLLRRLATDDPTMQECADEFSDYILLGLDRSVDARENGTVGPDRVVDVQFADFMSDQIGTIRTIYDHFGMELASEVEERMRAFLRDHPQDKHGTHTYTFADTGLDAAETRDRAQRYQAYFDVAAERI
jgi:hypothetical protein